jgi:hypothetical protein
MATEKAVALLCSTSLCQLLCGPVHAQKRMTDEEVARTMLKMSRMIESLSGELSEVKLRYAAEALTKALSTNCNDGGD